MKRRDLEALFLPVTIYFSSPLALMEIRGQGEVRGHARQHTNIHAAGFCSSLIVVELFFLFFLSSLALKTSWKLQKCCMS